MPSDVFFKVATQMTVEDALSLMSTCQTFASDAVMQEFAMQTWSVEFWNRASKRNPRRVHTFTTREIVRIEQFQQILETLETRRWSIEDFYRYWKAESL